ncbi:MAG: EamA family transporter [Verrucomicrobiota bacterium]
MNDALTAASPGKPGAPDAPAASLREIRGTGPQNEAGPPAGAGEETPHGSRPTAVKAASPGTVPVSPSSKPAPLGLVIAAFAAVYIIWGSTYLGITLAVKTIPPFLMAGTRFIIAGGFLLAVMLRLGAARPTRREWISASIIGALLIFAGNGGVSWAQGRVASGTTALIIASVPLWIMIVDWLRPHGVRPSRAVVLGLITGAAGVVMIILSRDSHGHRATDPVGAAVLLAAALCWALGSVYARHSPKPASALTTVAMQMLAGGVLQFVVGLLMGEGARFHPETVTASSAWAFVYLTVIGSLVGYTAYVWLLQVSTPAKVSTYAYVNPFVAVLLGHLVLKEELPGSVLMAGILILASVILITRAPKAVPASEN